MDHRETRNQTHTTALAFLGISGELRNATYRHVLLPRTTPVLMPGKSTLEPAVLLVCGPMRREATSIYQDEAVQMTIFTAAEAVTMRNGAPDRPTGDPEYAFLASPLTETMAALARTPASAAEAPPATDIVLGAGSWLGIHHPPCL